MENPIHFRDIYTSVLTQMGLEKNDLSSLHQGRKERLTDVQGKGIEQIG